MEWLNTSIDWLTLLFQDWIVVYFLMLPEALQTVVLIVLKIVVIMVPLMLSVAYLTLAERKVIGAMQVRMGPTIVGPRGSLQPIADAVKLMFKENINPTGANKYLVLTAPFLTIGPALAAWAVYPLGKVLF